MTCEGKRILMGYVNDTAMSQWIPPTAIGKTAGTWTDTLASNAYYQRRTAADANSTLFVPIQLPSNSVAQKGAYLRSIEVIYNVTTAALDDFATVELEKVSSTSGGTVTGTAPTITIDSGHDTAAERKATGVHRMTVTLSTPAWIDNDEWYVLEMILDHATTSVFDLYGAIANYTLRI
jgi:hypothetical protein